VGTCWGFVTYCAYRKISKYLLIPVLFFRVYFALFDIDTGVKACAG